MPCSGPRASPFMSARSAARAAARAKSAVTVQNAFTIGLMRSTRSSTARVSSTGESFLARISPASSVAGVNARSVEAITISPLLLGDQPVPERQMREPRALERVHRVLGRAHEWLAVEVERGIEHGADSRPALELADDAVVARVPRLVEEVGARRALLRMDRGDSLVTPLRVGRERQHHIRRGEALRVQEIVALALAQHRWREWHPEVPALDHPVDQVDDAVIGRIRQDRAVAESPRPELHAARAARDDAVGPEQLCDLLLDRGVLAHAVAAREVAPLAHGLALRFLDVGAG